MSNIETVANYYIRYDEADQIIDEQTQLPFPVDAYSRMKYGDRMATENFALDLATALADTTPRLVDSPTPPEFLVAYKAVPPACYYLSRYCLNVLNLYRAGYGNEPGNLTQIYKSRVTATNYALANAETRAQELNDIGFTLGGQSLEGAPVVILDDVRITGGAEKRILEVVAPEQPRSITLGYVALLDPEQAMQRPSTEMDLNSATITGIGDLLPSIQADNFDLNIRTLKMILGSDPAVLEEFLAGCPPELVSDILNGATQTGDDFIGNYQLAYALVRRHASQRKA